jgi:hypothetical protein
MEIRPDHGLEKVGQGAPPRRGEGGSEPGWASHDPHHRVLGGPHAPHPARPGGRSTKERLAAMRRTVVGQRRVRER